MIMKTHHLILSFSISLLALLSQASVSRGHSDTSTVGIIYGPKGDNLPHLSEVAKLLQTTKITDVMVVGNVSPYVLQKIVHARPLVKLIVKPGAKKQQQLIEMMSITEKSTNKKHGVDVALEWLQSNVLALSNDNTVTGDRGMQVSCIVIGTDGIFKDQKNLPYLIPTLRNLHGALKRLNLADKIKLSSPILSSILIEGHDAAADDNSRNKFDRGCAKIYGCRRGGQPPSGYDVDGDQDDKKADRHKAIQSTLSELMKFLSETGSPMFLKVDRLEPNKPKSHTLKVIETMLSQLDSMQPAMDSRISNVVIETGRPTSGDRSAEMHTALAYNTELTKAVNEKHFWPGVKFQLFFGGLSAEKSKEEISKGTSEILG